jgi:ABC-type oligopeptide transport system substrate-binding subunit
MYTSRQEQKPDFWGASNKKVRAEKIQIFSDLKKIYSSLQIGKIEIFYDPQKFSNPVISPLQLSTDFTT